MQKALNVFAAFDQAGDPRQPIVGLRTDFVYAVIGKNTPGSWRRFGCRAVVLLSPRGRTQDNQKKKNYR
jgi:hypothetical protein